MKRVLISTLALLLCAQSFGQRWTFDPVPMKQGDLGNGKYLNPVFGGDYPDPTIVRDGDDYYMTHSAFDYVPGLAVFHSKDLVNWTPISYALTKYLGSVWAPDISKYKNKYYIYFTVATYNPGARKNYVVWADTPYGPWSEPVDLLIGNIDPCHVIGEDGSRWMFMSGGRRVRLTDDGLAIVPGTLEVVYAGWPIPNDWITEGMALEGPKLRRVGEYFYYLNAQGGTSGPPTSHMIVVARSKSINGPWEDCPFNPVVRTWDNNDRWWSKGHGSLIDTHDGQWAVIYHSYENGYYNLGRQCVLEPVQWTKDGWFRTKRGTNIEKPIKKPIPSERPAADRHSRLGEFRVGLDWKFYKEYDPQRFSVKDGILTMRAKGSSPGTSFPILCVAGEHAYEVEAEIEITEKASAGIIIYYNSSFYAGMGFNTERKLRYRQGVERGAGTLDNAKKMWIRVRNDNHIVTAYFSPDGLNWTKEGSAMEISGYNHNTLYEFQSMLPGLYAAGEGEVKFSNFKYRSL